MKSIRWQGVLYVLLIISLISITFGQPAFSTTIYNQTKAEELQKLGILRGSDQGFELERSLSRVEGSVMLVRLLGDEQYALNRKYAHPFVDVPGWANDYIGYLYKKGLTRGVSADRFASSDLMTAAQYGTFVLRALGYSDSLGDFQWNLAVDKLVEINSIPGIDAERATSRTFLRDDMVSFSYYALDTLQKGTTFTLKDKLIEKGAIAKQRDDVINIQGIAIGDPLNDLIALRGNPNRIDASQYDFDWYIYNNNYQQYLQAGVKDNRIVALTSNVLPWRGLGLDHQSNRVKVRSILGEPLDGILIDNTKYAETANDRDVYLISEQYYIYVYYDLFDNDKVEAILLLDKKSRETLSGIYSSGSSDLAKAFELQVLDLLNATRVKRGLTTMTWSNQAADVARNHSRDMMQRGYFDHTNQSGETFVNRMQNAGIAFHSVAENLAAGGEDAIRAHAQWMNSAGHRVNMLSQQTYLGVGVSFGGEYKVYFTQNFFTP
ncbi:CAP-associated domain-containing protein [Desulfuribacillus alkaliarsenatis]|uniref:SLH domain-containing protein n=1 Tax=Desulfuribacillus alkaliarsenatis TaxID=766136 RepID=A0A1E5G0Y1_9FIRM|nr:CAP-associated domain-containing protein [Desulfuribacillus alkaliarsenatis]OEF96572.1 hypothetical protein BHF68_07965 [Desulfuribacillus alkaliarsenatis]